MLHSRILSQTVSHSILELVNELKSFNRNDILVNFSGNETIEIPDDQQQLIIPADTALNKSFKRAQAVFRESGTSVFCVSKGILHWNWKGTACETPIFLFPCQLTFDKIKGLYTLQWDHEDGFINPFLVFYFEREFDFLWPEINPAAPLWENLNEYLRQKGFDVLAVNRSHYGNFHHHRFSVLRELEQLYVEPEFSGVLRHLFQANEDTKTERIELDPRNLFPTDNNQLEVFASVSKQNLVVHGPPGTGKSQVLSNLVGKHLIGRKRTLVVSEKRVALEVIRQKLEQMNLHHFLFLQAENTSAQTLLNQLKNTWQFLESFKPHVNQDIVLSKLKLDQLQFRLNVLSNPEQLGGISYTEFQKLKGDLDFDLIPYSSNAPTIKAWLNCKNSVQKLYAQNIHQLCAYLPQHTLHDSTAFELDSKVKNLEESWTNLQQHFAINSKNDLTTFLHRAIVAQLMINEIHQDYFKTLDPNGSDRKKFDRLSKKYFVLKKELEIMQDEQDFWLQRPSYTETEQLILHGNQTGFFAKRKFKKHLRSIIKHPFIPIEKALAENLVYQQKRHDFREIEKKLTEIGVKTETEIHWIKSLNRQLNSENYAHWRASTFEENKKLADANHQLNTFQHALNTYLKLTDDTSFRSVFDHFQTGFAQFLTYRKELVELDRGLYHLIGEQKDWTQLEKQILKSNWVRFLEQFPSFDSFELNQIIDQLDEIVALQEREAIEFSQTIIAQQKERFDTLSNFLQTPTRQLSAADKVRKNSLRKGRTLLIKEFGKTRNHPTIRELLQSDASEWIYTLLPIWLVNSAQVGDYFPLEKDLFDFVLFDEATQIPLSHALGSLQRAKRAVVLGDEHQMAPSHFFKAGDAEPLDLLHQARYSWPTIMLKHHYRSEHPELISFSNRHFYNNQLLAYPHAQKSTNPIQLHIVEKGRYVNQVNKTEAQHLAKKIREVLIQEQTTVGIVAFSEKQLKCIWQQLSDQDQKTIDERIAKNTLFFRTLENVQGEECDHLLISFGYGKNEDDKLHLNFGPLNRKSGARRLNVLFSRAKKKIDFFTSLHSHDLDLSDNDSVNLLRQFLQFSEKHASEQTYIFPLNLEIEKLGKGGDRREIQFKNTLDVLSDANEFLTLYRVLTARGWQLKLA